MRDYMLRVDQEREVAAERPCGTCRHPIREHRELPAFTWALVDGEVTEISNPAYWPLHFHCALCDCVNVLDGTTGKALPK